MTKEKKVTKENTNTKSKFITIAIISTIIILIIGIIFGITKSHNIKKENASIRINEIEKRLDEITKETDSLNKQMLDLDFFDDQYPELSKKVRDLNIEERKLTEEKEELTEENFLSADEKTGIFIISGFFAIQGIFSVLFFITFIIIFTMVIIRIVNGTKNMNLNSKIIKNEHNTRLFIPKYKTLRCPNCHATIKGNKELEVCEYCGASLIKVYESNIK